MNDKMAIFIFSVNIINRLLLSFLVLTKVITLSGIHCTYSCSASVVRAAFHHKNAKPLAMYGRYNLDSSFFPAKQLKIYFA